MTEDSTAQHEPGDEVFPAFLCPACGYGCATTWATRPANTPDSIFYERGKVLIAIARQMPLRTVCIHPDGTSSYGGAERAHLQGTGPQRLVTPEEAQAILIDDTRLAHLLAPKEIEDALLLALAGPLAERLSCYVRPQDYPEEFAYAYDRLSALPDTSPLVAHDTDLQLTAIQDLIIGLLNVADEDLGMAVLDILDRRHILTPTMIQAVMEHPVQASDETEGQQ